MSIDSGLRGGFVIGFSVYPSKNQHDGRVGVEQEVGKWWQQHRVRITRLPDQAEVALYVLSGDATDQEFGDVCRRCLRYPRRSSLGRAQSNLALVQDMCDEPFPSLRRLECLGQQRLGFEDLDVAVAHQFAEGVVLALGLGPPQHVVEEELLCVRRSEAVVLESGPVHHDSVEPADLRVNAKCHMSVLLLPRAHSSSLSRHGHLVTTEDVVRTPSNAVEMRVPPVAATKSSMSDNCSVTAACGSVPKPK